MPDAIVPFTSKTIGEWCTSHGWRMVGDHDLQGTEDQCVVIFRRYAALSAMIYPEHLGRAKNQLIIVTTTSSHFAGVARLKGNLVARCEYFHHRYFPGAVDI